MPEPARHIDIGFQGGQVLPCRVKQEDFDSLHKALADGSSDSTPAQPAEPAASGPWHELTTLDSKVLLDLSQIVYLRMDAEDQKVGF